MNSKDRHRVIRTYMGLTGVGAPSALSVLKRHASLRNVDAILAASIFMCLHIVLCCLSVFKRFLRAALVMEPSIVISVEGNIGSGKSTLIRSLSSQSGRVRFALERTGRMWWWLMRKVSSSDGRRSKALWVLNFQMFVLLTQLWEFVTGMWFPIVVIMERSVMSSLLVFVKHSMSTGDILGPDAAFLANVVRRMDCMPDMYAFVNTTAEESIVNVKKRGRPEEQSLGVEYLVHLESLHHDMRRFLTYSGICMYEKILDATKDLELVVGIMEN